MGTEICVFIMVKHQTLDHDISNSLTRISSLEIVYCVRKKLLILKRVKNIYIFKSCKLFLYVEFLIFNKILMNF